MNLRLVSERSAGRALSGGVDAPAASRRPRVAFAPLTTLVLAVAMLAPGTTGAADVGVGGPGGPLDPAAEAATFRFADTNLTATLVASEPDVTSPVALAWDATGALFVAEMRDYPNATHGGVIRRLVDRDGDGRYEASGVFAEGLPFPNSVLPWRDGVLVTAAPDLLFLRDADGDGRAEERQVLFTGFGTGNQQLRANGLTWGLDGWVYGANGRSDGAVRRPGSTNVVSLRGRDFRFRPDTGAFESLAGRSQFGLGLDDWGNRFLSWNTIPVRHEVFPDAFLARNAALPAVDVVADLLPPDDSGRVYPLTPSPLVFNSESSGHFNALAGLMVYRGMGLGPAYRGSVFVGESLRNLIHRRVLEPAGATFVARRGALEQETEFLRAGDPWFHPVHFATGPDGALYVADFYRRFVEHPDFVPREMRDRMPWREGEAHGRIWRLARRGAVPAAAASKNMDRLAARALVQELDSDNAWRRDTAARLLRERRDPASVPALRDRTRRASHPEARLLALHGLAWMGVLHETDLLAAFQDPHPGVRAQAVRLAADAPASVRTDRLAKALAALVTAPDERVRLEVALALGTVLDAAVREPALEALLAGERDPWVRWAALSSAGTWSRERVAALAPRPASVGPRRPPPPPATAATADPDRAKVVERFRPALALTGDPARGGATFERLCLACHYRQGKGQRVGPDLSGVASRPPEALLVDILDPSRSVAPDYAAYELSLTDGESVVGLIASETATRFTLRRAGAADENLARSRVTAVRATGRSLMPDGLEAGWTAQDLADLLAFLRTP